MKIYVRKQETGYTVSFDEFQENQMYIPKSEYCIENIDGLKYLVFYVTGTLHQIALFGEASFEWELF